MILEIKLDTNENGFLGQLDYEGEIFQAIGKTKGYIKARIAKIFSKKFSVEVLFKLKEQVISAQMAKKEIKIEAVKKPKSTIDINSLPIYSDPTLVVAGDKAKFNFNAAMTDWCVVDILQVEEKHGGIYIHWSMEHDATKSFRTFVRPGNPGGDKSWIVGTTITAEKVTQLSK